jgi:hypothetical protein
MSETRRCFVLREVEIDVAQVRKADIFRLEPADDDDDVPTRWNVATADAAPFGRAGDFSVECEPVQVTLQQPLRAAIKQ